MQTKDYQNIIRGFFEEGTTQETLFNGLASEVGEVMSERVAETRRGEWRTEEILDELSDVLWYVATIAAHRGSSLEKLMDHNVNKLSERNLMDTWPVEWCECVSCGNPTTSGDFCSFCLAEE